MKDIYQEATDKALGKDMLNKTIKPVRIKMSFNEQVAFRKKYGDAVYLALPLI